MPADGVSEARVEKLREESRATNVSTSRIEYVGQNPVKRGLR